MRFQVLTNGLVTQRLEPKLLPWLATQCTVHWTPMICPDGAGTAGRPTYVSILGWAWLGSIGIGMANMHLLPGPNPRPG